jgi:hypothetical protein
VLRQVAAVDTDGEGLMASLPQPQAMPKSATASNERRRGFTACVMIAPERSAGCIRVSTIFLNWRRLRASGKGVKQASSPQAPLSPLPKHPNASAHHPQRTQQNQQADIAHEGAD